MRKFLITFFKFIFPIVLISYGLDIFISKNLLKSNIFEGEYEVWNDIYKGNINADIAIYGSSRAWVHISPNIMEDSLNVSVYNLGINGQNFWIQYLRHLEYVEYNKLPKQIILVVDINSLQKRKDLYRFNQFLPYMLWNKNIRDFTQSYKSFTYLDYYLPLLRYSGQAKVNKEALKLALTNGSIQPYRQKGYRGIEKKWNGNLLKAKLIKKQFELNIDTLSLDLFNQFLLECYKKNIIVTIVNAPMFVEGQTIVENREEYFNIYKNYANKYNLNYIDYSNDLICFKKKYFYNYLHLNKTGAELFSKKLAHDLKILFKE